MEQRTNETNELKREKVRIVEISKIRDFPDHPFLVKDDESMEQLVHIDTEGAFPSHAQTIRMRALSKEGKLDTDAINAIFQNA